MNSYKTYLVMLAISGLGSWLLTPLAIRLAHAWGALDIPTSRKIHAHPMPRLGGIAVFCGFILPWGGLYLLHNPVSGVFQNYERLFLALVLGAATMLLLGIYDDIKGANAAKKFLVQAGAALALWFAGFRIESLSNPWGDPIQLAGPISLGISVLWMVGVTNAINLLDGIDGLVAGVTAVIAICLAMINAIGGNIILTLLTLCLAGACLGFLPHNYSPARIFLGDSGSLTIGIVLACIGIISFFPSNGSGGVSPIISVPLILFGLPIFDTFRVMLKRAFTGASLFQADRNHVHHKLLELGLTHKQAAWALYLVAAVAGVVAVVLSTLPAGRQFLFSSLFCILAGITYFVWRFLQRAPETGDDTGTVPR